MLALQAFITDCARCIAFLSRFPMPSRCFSGYDGSLSRAVRAFPVAGLVIAVPAATLLCLLRLLEVDALFAAVLTMALLTLSTGALHEDGLSDAADGLGGGATREAALDIMKDSRIGAYGAVTLVLSLLLRVAALAAILPHLSPAGAALTLLAVAGLSRAAMVWHWRQLPPARAKGVAVAVGAPQADAARFALVSGVILTVALLHGGQVPARAILLALFASALAVMAFGRLVNRRIAGHTGDTIGATQQLAEIAALSALALAV